MKAFYNSVLWFAIGCAAVLPAAGQSDLPEGKGRDEVANMCSSCHGLDVVTQMRATKSGWAQTVDDMVGKGAQGTDEQVTLVVNYLAQHFGKTVNVNKATVNELQDGLSISANDAGAIAKYRADNGNFKDLEDLLKVPGVEAEKIKEQAANIVF